MWRHSSEYSAKVPPARRAHVLTYIWTVSRPELLVRCFYLCRVLPHRQAYFTHAAERPKPQHFLLPLHNTPSTL